MAAARSPSANQAGWNTADVTVALSADDDVGGSGVEQLAYGAGGAQTVRDTMVNGRRASLTVGAEGRTIVRYRASDNAGNVGLMQGVEVKIDKTKPVVIASARTTDRKEYAAGTWTSQDVSVTFACTDGLSGVASVSGPKKVSDDGKDQSASGTCTDRAGNSSSATFGGINIDKTPPAVTCSATPSSLWPPNHKLQPVSASVRVTDALSGQAGFTLTSVTSSQPDAAVDEDDVPGDIQSWDLDTPDTNGQFRAERAGAIKEGRVYTLTYKGLDKAGNAATCRSSVSVPHDRGR